MTCSLVIRTDGTCERHTTVARATASKVFDELTLEVITVRHPLFDENDFIMYIDDWGATKELPLNVKAWALYGGSPVFGDAVLGQDDQLEIPDRLLALIEREDFPDPIIKAQMRAFLTRTGASPDAVPAG